MISVKCVAAAAVVLVLIETEQARALRLPWTTTTTTWTTRLSHQEKKPSRTTRRGVEELEKENVMLKRRLEALERISTSGETLVFADDRWQPMAKAGDASRIAEVSDARLERVVDGSEGGAVRWHVTSPQVFRYVVREEPDLLGESNALILGHLATAEARAEEARRYERTGRRRRLAIVDETVMAMHAEAIEAYFARALERGVISEYRIEAMPTRETRKNMALVQRVATAVKDFGVDRNVEPVIAIGGGVCLDTVGLACTLYRRKTPYVRVPTTLLAYVDASVGAKTGVNFAGAKNRLGAYVPPAAALLTTHFLTTQDERATIAGAAEIMKMALVKSPGLFALLEVYGARLVRARFADASPESTDTLRLAIETMLEELAPNLWEHRLDRLVDFGHVFGLELEMRVLDDLDESLDEDDPPVTHGESVAIDMAYSTVLAAHLGLVSVQIRDRILSAMRAVGFPLYHPRFSKTLLKTALQERLSHALKPRLPLPTGLGQARIFNDVSLDDLYAAHDIYSALCAPVPYPYWENNYEPPR